MQVFEGSQFAPLKSIRCCYLNRFTYHQCLQTLNWCAGNQQSLPSVRLLLFCVILQISSVLRYSTQDIGSSNQIFHTYSKIKKVANSGLEGIGQIHRKRNPWRITENSKTTSDSGRLRVQVSLKYSPNLFCNLCSSPSLPVPLAAGLGHCWGWPNGYLFSHSTFE